MGVQRFFVVDVVAVVVDVVVVQLIAVVIDQQLQDLVGNYLLHRPQLKSKIKYPDGKLPKKLSESLSFVSGILAQCADFVVNIKKLSFLLYFPFFFQYFVTSLLHFVTFIEFFFLKVICIQLEWHLFQDKLSLTEKWDMKNQVAMFFHE